MPTTKKAWFDDQKKKKTIFPKLNKDKKKDKNSKKNLTEKERAKRLENVFILFYFILFLINFNSLFI